MKTISCDICGKKIINAGKYIGNPVFSVLDVEDVCEECASLFYRGREEFNDFILKVRLEAQTKIKAHIKDGRCTLGNKYKGEVV